MTTDSDHKLPIAPNLLDRNFTADSANQKWAGDIAYLYTSEGWMYLAVIIDLHSRTVISWSISDRMQASLVCNALKAALLCIESFLNGPLSTVIAVASTTQTIIATC